MTPDNVYEAIAALSLGSVIRSCWQTYWLSLGSTAVWLVVSLWLSRRDSSPWSDLLPRRVGSGPRVLCVLVSLWGLEATMKHLSLFEMAFHSGPPTQWHESLFTHWLEIFHCLLALVGIAGAALLAHLVRHGHRFESSVASLVAVSAVIFTVVVDWLFGLFLITPFS